MDCIVLRDDALLAVWMAQQVIWKVYDPAARLSHLEVLSPSGEREVDAYHVSLQAHAAHALGHAHHSFNCQMARDRGVWQPRTVVVDGQYTFHFLRTAAAAGSFWESGSYCLRSDPELASRQPITFYARQQET